MDKEQFITDFACLGDLLRRYLFGQKGLAELDNAIKQSVEANPWFTDYHIKERLAAIAYDYLSAQKLGVWLANYPDVWYGFQRDITVVMAGNVPLVGFHDYLSVLASGRTVSVKSSSKDPLLLPALHDLLCSFAPEWRSKARFVPEVPFDTDGLIATGSHATAAWFGARYPHLPKVVRGHRVSAAIVPIEITEEQIAALHKDMFLFFGLGCRSVVRLFVPENFDLSRLTDLERLPKEASHPRFQNAYRRQKALLSLHNTPFVDGGFFLLQEVDEWHPPVATVYYTYYHSLCKAWNCLETNASQIQCVVGNFAGSKKCITFGSVQRPSLCDYADGIDTMRL